MSDWETARVIACEDETGARYSVIEQIEVAADACVNAMRRSDKSPLVRYVLGNSASVVKMHDTSYIVVDTATELTPCSGELLPSVKRSA